VNLLLLKSLLVIESQGPMKIIFFASPTRSATVWQFINFMQHMPGGITSVSLESPEINRYLVRSLNWLSIYRVHTPEGISNTGITWTPQCRLITSRGV